MGWKWLSSPAPKGFLLFCHLSPIPHPQFYSPFRIAFPSAANYTDNSDRHSLRLTNIKGEAHYVNFHQYRTLQRPSR